MQVFTCILCSLLVFLVSGCWFFGGFYLNFWKSKSIPLKSLRNCLFLSQNTIQEKSILKCFLRWQGGLRGEGGTPWAHCYAFKLVIMGIGAYKVCGAWQCFSMRRRYPWQPCELPPPGTVTLNYSVEYLLTNTYLALTSRGREGWEKQKHKMSRKRRAIATTLCEELKQATAYLSHKVPLLEASGHPQNSWKNCCPKSDKHLFSSNNQYTIKRKGCENR